MELAKQFISNDNIVRSNTVQNLKDFNSQSLTTLAQKGKQLVSVMPAIQKAFDLVGDDILDLSTENGTLEIKIGSYDETWLDESKSKI